MEHSEPEPHTMLQTCHFWQEWMFLYECSHLLTSLGTCISRGTPVEVKRERGNSCRYVAPDKNNATILYLPVLIHRTQLLYHFELNKQSRETEWRRAKTIHLPPQNEGMYFCPTWHGVEDTPSRIPLGRAPFAAFFLLHHQSREEWNERDTKVGPNSTQAGTVANHNPYVCLEQA